MDDATKSEFSRLHDENNRQNHRIAKLEDDVSAIQELTLSVKELAINMQHMLTEQKEQGNRLKELETQPLQTVKGVKSTAINTLVGVIVGALATGLILMIAQNLH